MEIKKPAVEKMDINKVDPNFAKREITETDIDWKKATDKAFELRGVFYDEEAGCFYRMKKEIADQVSPGVSVLSRCMIGGRVRFKTNSPYITVRVKSIKLNMSWNYSLFARCGLCIYVNGVYEGQIHAEFKQWENADDDIMYYDGIYYSQKRSLYEVEIYLPNYSEKIFDIEIGTKPGAEILPPRPYKYNDKPVVFYGSSITQGACASRAGTDYTSVLCRWLDTDFINLGFSGNGKAEPIMAEYLANLDPSVYFLDYDYNAPNVEYLKKTHMPLYRTIRAKHPTTPIIFVSAPIYYRNPKLTKPRREVIYQNYLAAKAEGDENVWFIDGKKMLPKKIFDSCVTDLVHPNDLGYHTMAKYAMPTLLEALEKDKANRKK